MSQKNKLSGKEFDEILNLMKFVSPDSENDQFTYCTTPAQYWHLAVI